MTWRLISSGRVHQWRPRLRYLVAVLAVELLAGVLGISSSAMATSQALPSQASNTFAIRDVNIFNGFRDIGIGSVLVIRGRIAAVGQMPVPPGIPVYDGHGDTVLPGLIDSSAHTLDQVTDDPTQAFPRSATPALSAMDRNDALRFGVTTEITTFGDPTLIAAARQERQSLDRTDEADLWSSGVGVTVPNGNPPDAVLGYAFPRLTAGTDPDQFVASDLQQGSDFISLIIDDGSLYGGLSPTLTVDQASAVVAAAHRYGRLAVAESPDLNDVEIAVQAGVNGLNHPPFDKVMDNTLVQTIRRQHIFVITAMAAFDCGQGAAQLLQNPLVQPYLSARQITALNLRFPFCPNWLQVGSENIGLLHAAGVPIVVGTDAGGGASHGASMLSELAELVNDAGLTPAQALTAATATPAREFGLCDRGRIAPGMRADLLMVNGDPTTDINAMPDIAEIWKNGYPIDRTPS